MAGKGKALKFSLRCGTPGCTKLHVLDAFCGAGGMSTGTGKACASIGFDVQAGEVDLLGVNHWTTAINSHSVNLPWARHLCVSFEAVNPRDAFPGGVVHLLCASPECTHHSTARGGKPVNDQLRASAWHIMRWVNELDVRNILIENVPEFEGWGPVSKKTGRPIARERGRYFKAFIDALVQCGYTVQWRVLNAADYGDPTSRKRLFIIARKGRRAPAWPTPTHSKGGLMPGTQRWRAAREVIDWSIEGKSIFDRERPLSDKTIERILKGLERHGGPALQPFLVLLRGGDARRSSGSIEAPVPTLTAGGEHVDVAEPFLLGQQSGGAPRPVSQPLPTLAAGGAVALVDSVIVPPDGPGGNGEHNHAKPVTDPLPTIRASRDMHLAEAVLVDTIGSKDTWPARTKSIEEPVPTVMGDAGRWGVAAPVLVPYNGNSTPASVDQPLPTQPTHDRFGVAEPFLITTDRLETNRSLPRPVSEPVPTITAAAERVGLAEAFIVPQFGERDGQAPRTHSIQDPLPAVTSHGAGALVKPVIQTLTHGGRTRSMDEPLPTVTTATRGELALVEPRIIEEDCPDDPTRVHTQDGHCTPRALIMGSGGPRGQMEPRDIERPLPTVIGNTRLGLVQPVIDGKRLDIRFRMLQPHELSQAMGFPADYKFQGNRRDVVKQIGNAVAVNMAMNLARALLDAKTAAQTNLDAHGEEATEVPA